jgi:hypothetical protein
VGCVCDCRITAANVSVTAVKVKITAINVSISAEESKSHGPGKLISSGGITRAIDLSNNGGESEDNSHNYKDSGHKSPHPHPTKTMNFYLFSPKVSIYI